MTIARPQMRKDKPDINKPVLAIVQFWGTKITRYALLYAVEEGDQDYRTVDDDSELSYAWTVIAWDYLSD